MYFITTVLLNFRIYTFLKIFKLYRSVKSGSPPTHTSFIYISSRKVRDKRQQQIRLILLCFGGCVTKSNSVFISVHFQFCSHQTLVSHSFHSFPFWDDTLLLIGSFHSSFCLLSNLNKHSTVRWVIPHLFKHTRTPQLCTGCPRKCPNLWPKLFYGQERNIKVNHFVWNNYWHLC